MEAGGFLDIVDKTKVEALPVLAPKATVAVHKGYMRPATVVTAGSHGQRNFGLLPLFLFSLICVLCLCSCSLPRIIVLDDPLTPEEHLNLGVAYENNGEFDNALKEYEIASKKLAGAYLYMGNIYFRKKEYESAESNYRKAIKKDPGNADAYNNLAWLYYVRKENLEEAGKLVAKAIALNPSKTGVYKDTLDKINELKHPK